MATKIKIQNKNMKKIFKNDKYKKARCGHSRLLKIDCQKCKENICLYQKDGPGILKRMYIDRIINPGVSISKKELLCSKKHLIGIKFIYEKENRLSYRLFIDSVTKKIVKI